MIDTQSFANANYDFNYQIPPNSRPSSPLGGIPFDIPSIGNNFYLFSDSNPDPLIIPINNVSEITKVYFLINTSWGIPGYHSGSIQFYFDGSNTPGFLYDLYCGLNVRDWNDGTYANSVSSPDVTPDVYWILSDQWGTPGRIDLLTVSIPSTFFNSLLTKIVIEDYGRDYESRLRVAGITLKTAVAPVPEPSGLSYCLLSFGALFWIRKKIYSPENI